MVYYFASNLYQWTNILNMKTLHNFVLCSNFRVGHNLWKWFVLWKGSYCSVNRTRKSKWDEKNFCFYFKMTGSLAKQQSKEGYPGEKKPLLQQLPTRDYERILTFSDQNECEKQQGKRSTTRSHEEFYLLRRYLCTHAHKISTAGAQPLPGSWTLIDF